MADRIGCELELLFQASAYQLRRRRLAPAPASSPGRRA